MTEDSISIAAAILMTEFVRKDALDQTSAVREWRRMRRNMIKTLAREEEKIAIETAVAASISAAVPEPSPQAPAPKTSRTRKVASTER